MPESRIRVPASASAGHGGAEDASRAPLAMANREDQRAGLELTSRGFVREGRPWIPVSGELHYTRVPRGRWRQRLAQLRAGGVDVVSTYVPWLHHVPRRGECDFTGNRDIAAFLDVAQEEGFDVVLRIGPWIHGETRNGGFPDWVQAADVAHRTDDPGYLALVREWWTQLATALAGRCTPERVLAIQLENELIDAPEHLLTLKRLARELGMSAPLWTATAWDGARLPLPEVFPLNGGYGDGFWVDPGEPWHPSFRAHFGFSHVWDGPGVGDLFPPATCELGGGMATAYHRRPLPAPLDVAAVAHVKLGSGSVWQGYYMYAGGTNPGRDLQESHATGYPNDLPELGYDFHAPIGESGRLSPTHALLRRQHAFVAAFASDLARGASHLASGPGLRWAYRGDAEGGFVFITTHQPHEPLPAWEGRLTVELPGREVSLDVAVPPGTLARWPVGLAVGGVVLEWATASALTVLAGAVPTLVLVAEPGIAPRVQVRGGDVLTPEPLVAHRVAAADGGVADVVVVPAELADDVWVAPGRLLLSRDELSWSPELEVLASGAAPRVLAYCPEDGAFVPVAFEHVAGQARAEEVPVALARGAGRVPVGYGMRGKRQSAPAASEVADLAARYRLTCRSGLPIRMRVWRSTGLATLRSCSWAGRWSRTASGTVRRGARTALIGASPGAWSCACFPSRARRGFTSRPRPRSV